MASAHLPESGLDGGIVGDSLFNLQPVTVTTYDSAYLHMPDMGDRFGLVIFDEAHHLPSKAYRESALFCAAPSRLGLTATPDHADGRDADFPQLIGDRLSPGDRPRPRQDARRF